MSSLDVFPEEPHRELEASEEENARLKARVRGLEIQVPHRKLKHATKL